MKKDTGTRRQQTPRIGTRQYSDFKNWRSDILGVGRFRRSEIVSPGGAMTHATIDMHHFYILGFFSLGELKASPETLSEETHETGTG